MKIGTHNLKTLHIPALAVLTGAFMWQCTSFKGAQVNVKPNPLEVHADSVNFTVRASIPPKSGFKKGGVYDGKLAIDNNGTKYQFSQVIISSDQFPDIKKAGASTSVTAGKPYQPGMNGGMLQAMGNYSRKGKNVELPTIDLAPCCITTSLLLCDEPKHVMAPFNFEKQKPLTLEAKFQFPQNVFDIQPTEYEKAEILAIGDFLSKRYAASKVTISGFASPEGAYRRNEFLSIARSKEVKKWLAAQLNKAGYNIQLDSSFFAVATTTEDWEGFKANLSRKSFPEDVKRQIIDIISSGQDPATVENRVMALVGGADEVEDILAPLRRATIRLEGQTSNHTDAQIDQMLKDFLAGRKDKEATAAFFTADKMLYAINGLTDAADQHKALKDGFIEIYNKDWRGYNDLGVHELKTGNTERGMAYLNSALKMNNKATAVMINQGAAYLADKQYSKALYVLQEGKKAGSQAELAFNLGYALHKLARYPEAAEQFVTAGNLACAEYNAGLAKLLMNDLAGSRNSLEAAIRSDKNDAEAYYVLALLGARTADTNVMILNLKRAVQIDPSLGEKARKDLEFRKFFDDEQFRSATTQS
ncbi:MAG: hypothetical protein ACK5QE_01590 [Sphingobacteriia bacterium]|jgi:outer membrane protein OmpA-like peptidoglycan-associated protein/Tfp pilus assembly protein PilF